MIARAPTPGWPVNRVDGYTRLVGQIGWPAGNGLSPAIHNAAFNALGLNWCCVPLPVPVGRLCEALLGLRATGFVGAEVKGPHQCDAFNYLEPLGPAVEAIRAVNFIRVDERGWLAGDNTQWLGFLAALYAMVPSLNGLRPLVVGAGEAARAVVYALVHEGLPVTIVDSSIARAVELVDGLRRASGGHSLSLYHWPHDLAQVAPEPNLIINTLSPETCSEVGDSPWPDDVPFAPESIVFDLACQPTPQAGRKQCETPFLRQARAAGARTVDGLQLLVHEAALAFERWTGQASPLEVMIEAAGQVPGLRHP